MARSKRPNGEGSIYFSHTLNTWVAEMVMPDGKPKRKKNKLQRVVREWLEEQKEGLRKGVWVSKGTVRYGDFLNRYMDEVAEHNLRPKTLENYRYAIKNHINPNLGDMKIVQLRADHIQHLYSNLLNGGLSKSTVKYVHAIIRKSLGTARKWRLVSINVADDVDAPTPDPFEIRPLTVEETKKLLKVLEGDRLYAFYVLICTTGIRKGEALALQKKNLLLDEGILLVRNSLAQIYGKGLVLGEPKSKSSKRDLVLPQFTINVLRWHLSKYPNNSSFFFATGNDTPFSPRNILRHFKSKLVQAGLPPATRIHDLRYSVISWLLASGGISIKDAQGLAGHAQASTTLNIYGHLLPGYSKMQPLR